MLYEAAAGATFIICASTIFAQLAFIPLIWRGAHNIEYNLKHRVDSFMILSERAHVQLNSMRQHAYRSKRALKVCEPYEPGPPGPPGDDGDDGVPGLDGPDGERGMDARDIMREMGEKCIVCPRGPVGPVGAPGNQGPRGLKGDKGPPGTPGTDGRDGDMGAEGPVGYNGTAGRTGKKGPPGKSAPGGTGAPGPKGLVGPIGRTGPQGERGKRNFVYGPPGPQGKPGVNGMDGLVGSFGRRGEKGPIGEPGANAKFCPCAMELDMVNGRDQHKENAGMLIAKPNSDGAKIVAPSGGNPLASKTSVPARIDNDVIEAAQAEKRVSTSGTTSTPSHQVHQLHETPTVHTVQDAPSTSAPQPHDVTVTDSPYITSSLSPTSSQNSVHVGVTPPSRAQSVNNAVDMPDLSSVHPQLNIQSIPDHPAKYPESSIPPALSLRESASSSQVQTTTSQRPSSVSPNNPSDSTGMPRTTQDPVQAHPVKGTNDMTGSLSTSTTTTSTGRPQAQVSPSHQKALDLMNLDARLRALLDSLKAEDISGNVQGEKGLDLVGESVIFPDLIIAGDSGTEDVIISDESRRFFRGGVDEDSNRRTTTLQAISDLERTTKQRLKDAKVIGDSAEERGDNPGTGNSDSGGVKRFTEAPSSTSETPGEVITAYYEETAPPTRRRFVYVTKKPRAQNK